jgi:hypothetical protein
VHYRKPRGQLQKSGGDESVVKAGRGCCDKEKWKVRISGVSDEACDQYFAANEFFPDLGNSDIKSIIRKYSKSSRCSRSVPIRRLQDGGTGLAEPRGISGIGSLVGLEGGGGGGSRMVAVMMADMAAVVLEGVRLRSPGPESE